MRVERVESYSVEKHGSEVTLVLRQRTISVLVILICATVLGATSWFSPFEGAFYLLWMTFHGTMLFVAVLSLFYEHRTRITEREIIFGHALFGQHYARRARRSWPLALWVEFDDEDKCFRLHLMDIHGNTLRGGLVVRRRGSVDALIAALRSVLSVEVLDEP